MRFTRTRVLACMLAACALPALIGAPAHAADPVIAAAGDIACDTQSEFYNGGVGTAGHCRQRATSDLLVNGGLSAVLALGDTQYHVGALSDFEAVLRPDLGAREADHPPDRRQPRVRDLECAGLLRLLQRARQAERPRRRRATRGTTASTSAAGTWSR